MANQKVLIPYNFTSYDQKALDFVIRAFSHLEDAEVTLFNAYTPVPEVESRESPVLAKLQSNLAYLSQRLIEQEDDLKAAMQYLTQNGFSENRVRYFFQPRKKDIPGEIIDLALNDSFKVIVINRKPGKVTRFFTGSGFNKIVNALKDTVVCIVS